MRVLSETEVAAVSGAMRTGSMRNSYNYVDHTPGAGSPRQQQRETAGYNIGQDLWHPVENGRYLVSDVGHYIGSFF